MKDYKMELKHKAGHFLFRCASHFCPKVLCHKFQEELQIGMLQNYSAYHNVLPQPITTIAVPHPSPALSAMLSHISHICSYTYMRLHVYALTHICSYTYLLLHIYALTHICSFTYLLLHIYALTHISRVSQYRIYTPYMTVYLVNFLPKILYTHHIYTVL